MSEIREGTLRSADGTAIAYLSTGAGEPVAVVGGALRTAEDYLPLARALSETFEVHVLERRGRGATGPQGERYAIEREVEDLLALLERTHARRVFGHSYGGLVALETARREPGRISHLAVYEPGISAEPAASQSWLRRYVELLAAGDRRGAFACFVRRSGHAPGALERMPLAYVKLVLRIAVRGERWRRMEPLLEANLREHEEVARLAGGLDRYASISARTLLLAGAKSPARAAAEPLRRLAGIVPGAAVDALPGLAHDGPDEADPGRVAERVGRFYLTGAA